MNSGLSFLTDLPEPDVQWLLRNGEEQQVIINTVLLREGESANALIFVLEGLVGIRASFRDSQVAALGPGELIGEMGFIEQRPASVSVLAIENTLLLRVPYERIQQHFEEDTAFASRFHRAVALTVSRRLRERERLFGRLLTEESEQSGTVEDTWSRLEPYIEQFKELLHESDQKAIQNSGELSAEYAQKISSGFDAFVALIDAELGDAAGVHETVREKLGARVQREVLPYLLLTRSAERVYAKPRGYAGDFKSIDWIYENEAGGTGRLGPILDRCFLERHAAAAVRNRRGLLCRQIRKHANQHPERPTRITSMACGPAREIFDVIEELSDPTRIQATLIDTDIQALEQVRDEIKQRGLEQHVQAHHGNLIYLSMGRQKIELPPQDLMYSVGLIDYFNDKLVTRLMNWGHSCLTPGGEMILGNFHPKNPDKAMMDFVLDWRLIHRSEEDMNRLYAGSNFGHPCTSIEFEESGINLFAGCVRG